jgi:methionyl-tRNA formyltransferase
MNVLFMGTPEFACPSLTALAGSDHTVVGVVTRADKPSGRGQKIVPSPVKRLALDLGIPVLQSEKVNTPVALAAMRALDPSVLVVAAFGAILRTPLLNLAPFGALNVHASVLPAYRGVAPVPWALIHGKAASGVSLMRMDEGVDTGPVLGTRTVEAFPDETAGGLLARLALEGAELLIETLPAIEAGNATALPQDDAAATYAPRLEKEHGYLDLTRGARNAVNQFRGVTPAPGARVFLNDDPVLILDARRAPAGGGEPYAILEVGPDHLRVGAGDGAVDLRAVRPAGKPDMNAGAFARGRKLRPGDRFTPPPVVPDLSLKPAPPRTS